MNNLIPVQIQNETFQVLWDDLGPIRVLTVFKDGKALGQKEFSLLIDETPDLVHYAVKSILKQSLDL